MHNLARLVPLCLNCKTMNNTHNKLPKTLWGFIAYFLKPHKTAVTIFVLFGIAAGFWGPFNSILIKQLIDLLPLVTNGNISVLLLPAGLIALNFIIFDNVTWRTIAYIVTKYTPIITNHITGELMSHCLGKSNQFYQDNLSGKLAKQIGNLIEGIEKIISSGAANLLRGASILLMAFIVSYFVNPLFCLILVVWFMVFAISSLLLSKKLVTLSDAQAASESVVAGELVDSLSNHSTVRIFARKSYELSRMLPFLAAYQKAYTQNNFYALFVHSVEGGLIAIMMALTSFSLVFLYGKGLVTIGDFALILGLSMETGHLMWFTMSEIDELNKAVGKCKQSLNALMLPLEIEDAPNAAQLICTKGKITFEHVRFHYKGTKPLYDNLSIEIPSGQKVGLVGYSGGGKSTFVNLILRLYDVTNGAILIDDQNIKTVTQDSLRASIAMIPQDPSLFHRSLMDNIRYGRLDASNEEVLQAAQKAHAHEFIEKLPEGYASLVGERGVKLSGGQRQRIAIARAILKNAPILILDEATSQLDSVTENVIQQSLWKLMQGKTTVVIAHRLSTLLHMDRILVFHEGKIVEDGPHAQLLNQNGLYKTLWDAQVGGFLGDMKAT